MRVKLRPDAHCAPVPRGVYWLRGDRSFVLSGPPALYTLLDDQLDALLRGTSVDEMVAAAGDEAARPVFDHVVRALVAQDVLIDLDAVAGPLPDPRTADDHLELLAYLEANCAEPYRAFAAVRSARVAVAGGGPAAESVRRGLAANGTGAVTDLAVPGRPGDAGPALAVLIDDCEDPLDLHAAAESLPAGTPVLPVAAEADFALVGPVCTDLRELRSFQAVRARAADWQRTEGEAGAARPLSAVLSGSLAAQAVLTRLAETGDGARTALVVHGHAVQTRAVPVPDAVAGPAWRWVDAGEAAALSAPVEAAAAESGPATDAASGPPGSGPADPPAATPGSRTDAGTDAELQEVHRLAAGLTTRWTGVARWGRDLDLPQLPVSLVTAETVARPGPSGDRGPVAPEAPGPCFLGWGSTRVAAGLTAVLALLRHRAAQESGPGGGAEPAAGLTPAHWLADGLLRHVGRQVLTQSVSTTLTWDDFPSGPVRTLWSLLGDFFDVPATLELRTVPGLDWCLAGAVHEGTGELLAAQWGPSVLSAGYAALFAATGQAQFRAAEKNAPQSPVLPPDPVGTWSLEVAPERQVHDCLRGLLAHTAASGLRPRARLLVRDEAVGELPLACGLVGLA